MNHAQTEQKKIKTECYTICTVVSQHNSTVQLTNTSKQRSKTRKKFSINNSENCNRIPADEFIVKF